MTEKAKVIDLFCGVGGLSHGFVQEEFDVVAGFDIDESCQYAYETNNNAKFICKSVTSVTKEELNEKYGDDCEVKILVGCAPCQPFSTYNKRKRQDEKWALLKSFERMILDIEPDIVSMENVPNLQNQSIYHDFVKTLGKKGYKIDSKLVFCPDYGIAQTRKRLVLLASKLGDIELIPKTHSPEEYVSVEKIIKHLPPLQAGETHPSDPLHKARKLSQLNIKRLQATPIGGSWQDWPEELRLKCHRKDSGQSFSNVYGRMKWNEPAPTLTTYCVGIGNGRFGHPDPEQHRAISLREAALIQSFPEGYVFGNRDGSFATEHIARQIGNAVPVRLGQVVAQSIKKHLSELQKTTSN